MLRGSLSLVVTVVALLGNLPARAADGRVRVYPAPAGEEVAKAFAVTVDGQPVPIYTAKVASGDDKRRWKSMDDLQHSADYADVAYFGSFDMDGPVVVSVACPDEVRSAKVVPASYGIVPKIAGKTLTFTVDKPRQLTVEVNGNWVNSLHLFADGFEVDVPKKDDPNVIYFGPGVHEVKEGIKVSDGKTLYLAGGAILRGAGGAGGPVVSLRGKNVTLRGRGMIDGTLTPTHTRNLLAIRGSDIAVEGVTLRDAGTWNVPMRQSDRVTIRNVKILGNRPNSDGIDICNSRDVLVENCFLRTLDDLVVVKSDKGQGEVRKVVVRGCVLWNQVAHALSIGAELREPVGDVLFTDCDVIHDIGREWTLRVYHCDSAVISNVRFESIRVEQARRFMSLWIGKQVWTRDAERGHVRGVTFRDITATGVAEPVRVEFKGFDAQHVVEDVTVANVRVNGKVLTAGDVKSNEFVKDVRVTGAP